MACAGVISYMLATASVLVALAAWQERKGSRCDYRLDLNRAANNFINLAPFLDFTAHQGIPFVGMRHKFRNVSRA